MRKKFIGALLALSMVVACVPSVDAKAAEVQTYQAENSAYYASQESADLCKK